VDEKVGTANLTNLNADVAPSEDNKYNIGEQDRQWKAIYAHYGYISDNLYVQDKPVLKDGDPVTVMYFEGPAKDEIDQINTNTSRPSIIDTKTLSVGTRPVPLSDVDMIVKRIHVKVPRDSASVIYLGNSSEQNYVLEPGDLDVFEVQNPKSIYVRSLGDATIYIAFEE